MTAPAVPPPPPPPALPAPPAPPAVLRPGQLTEGWRWTLALGWAAALPALMAIGDAAHTLGKPTWWLNRLAEVDWSTPLPFLPLLAAALAAAANWRWWPYVCGAGVVSMAVTALVDAGRSPGAAVAEAVTAAAAAAVTFAAFAGRVRLPRN